MDRRQLLFGMTALGLAKWVNLNDVLSFQNIETPDWWPAAGNIRASDCQQAGLRGPVKIIIDEWCRTEYDRDGNALRVGKHA
jgi:hypothetical protein